MRRGRPRCSLGTHVAQARTDSGDLFFGKASPRPDLVDHLIRCLGEERLVRQFRGRRCQFLLGGSKFLLQPASLGLQIDGARRIEFDGDRRVAQARTDSGDLFFVSLASELIESSWATRSADSTPTRRAATFCLSLRP